MREILIGAAIVVGAAAALCLGASVYFFNKAMRRSKAKKEKTIKMAGTDWSQHMNLIQERKEMMLAQPHEDVYVTSEDGLKLHGIYFPGDRSKKLVICIHGYTSEALSDYIGLSKYYREKGFQMLMPDERAHGKSEGEYIGFGYKDRLDLLKWLEWVIKECGEDIEILLHGNSMGGSTVLMASGLDLPTQVKGIVADCAFTSPKEVFTHVLKNMYHIPAFPLIQITDWMNRRLAGYGLAACNAAEEVKKAKVPILLIHGDADTFVPGWMCDKIYENCPAKTQKLIVKGAAHAESYYKDIAAYEQALDTFIETIDSEAADRK